MQLWLIYVQFLVPRCPGSCPLWDRCVKPSCRRTLNSSPRTSYTHHKQTQEAYKFARLLNRSKRSRHAGRRLGIFREVRLRFRMNGERPSCARRRILSANSPRRRAVSVQNKKAGEKVGYFACVSANPFGAPLHGPGGLLDRSE